MATLSKGKTFGETEEVSATDLHDLVDKGSVSGIIAADISDNVITDAKMVSVSGAKLISLSGIPSGSGVIPSANLTSVAQKGANSDITSLSGLTTPLSIAQGGTGGNLVYAYVMFNAGTGTPVIAGSYNVTSITDVGVGKYTVNFTTAFSNANYCVLGVAGSAGGFTVTNQGTGSVTIWTYDISTGNLADANYVSVFVVQRE